MKSKKTALVAFNGTFSTPQNFVYVRVNRNNDVGINFRASDAADRRGELVVTRIKAQYASINNYGFYTMLAMRIPAGAFIQDTSVTIDCTRRLFRNGVLEDNNNIVHAILDLWTASYGASQPEANIDTAAFDAIHSTLDSRDDRVNIIFDRAETVWDSMRRIANIGRMALFFKGSMLSASRDEAKTVFTRAFSKENILQDTLSIEYTFLRPSDATDLRTEYYNEDDDYKSDFAVTDPDANFISDINILGITNRSQIIRELNYHKNILEKRRTIVSFRCELEGLNLNKYDLISLNHDLVEWGISGYVQSINQRTLEVSEELSGNVIAFRTDTGSLSSVYSFSVVPDNPNMILLDRDLTDVLSSEMIFYSGDSTDYIMQLVVDDVRPIDQFIYEITAFMYDSSIYRDPTIRNEVVVSQPKFLLPNLSAVRARRDFKSNHYRYKSNSVCTIDSQNTVSLVVKSQVGNFIVQEFFMDRNTTRFTFSLSLSAQLRFSPLMVALRNYGAPPINTDVYSETKAVLILG